MREPKNTQGMAGRRLVLVEPEQTKRTLFFRKAAEELLITSKFRGAFT